MDLRSTLGVLVGSLLLMLCSPTQASITAYTTEADFLTLIQTIGVDQFDDLPAGVELSTPLSRLAGQFSYVASAGPASDFLTASNGASDIWLSTNVGTDAMTFSNFSTGVQAVGGFFFGTDIAGNATTVPAITVTATDSDGTVIQTVLNPALSSFLGFASTGAVISLTVTVGDQPGVWATANDLTLGTVSSVPEPASFCLIAGGLAVFGVFARRNMH